MNDKIPIVFVVDDDKAVRKSLERLIKSVGLTVQAFSSAREFLESDPSAGPSCLVLDVRMPGLSGIDLQKELGKMGYTIPIIFITGYGDIPMSVRTMKRGAIDFLTKPFNDQDLLDAIHRAIEKDKQTRREQDEIGTIQQRVDSLTPREREVFSLVVTGMLNKQIAYDLGMSEKTVKVHRSRVMDKMQADSLAELVRLAYKVGIGSSTR
jgi:RNA polymerase sigma factor (sigma-70 family)